MCNLPLTDSASLYAFRSPTRNENVQRPQERHPLFIEDDDPLLVGKQIVTQTSAPEKTEARPKLSLVNKILCKGRDVRDGLNSFEHGANEASARFFAPLVRAMEYAEKSVENYLFP